MGYRDSNVIQYVRCAMPRIEGFDLSFPSDLFNWRTYVNALFVILSIKQILHKPQCE